jgi:N-methylhydantoinase B
MQGSLQDIRFQVMWNRLLAVVEEQAQTLIRTAFSTPVREAGDLSAGAFDTAGRMLAQAVTGTPGHVNSMAAAVGHYLQRIPADTLADGDVLISNDPWLTTGHMHDLTVVTPAFYNGRLVGYFAATGHVVDIGGRGFGPDAREVFEEGLRIPVMRLFERGRVNESLIEIIRANVREPYQVEGDVYSLKASNETGCRRLHTMMQEFELDSLDELADYILEVSRSATEERINAMPGGTFRNAMTIDGYDEPLELVAALTIERDKIKVDYAGSSPVSPYGINVAMTYCQAYTAYGIKCVVAPEVPNNAGSLSPFEITAPEGCILNAKSPSPVAARHVIGQLLPDVVLGCLHQVIPERVPAEGSSALWNIQLRGSGRFGQYEVASFHSGGTGARFKKDGLSATAFPSGVRTVPVEINENVAPLVFWRKELRVDSGGAGKTRGGLGQVMEIGSRSGEPFSVLAMFDRVDYPARGRSGGGAGACGEVRLASGTRLAGKGNQLIPENDRLILEMPGGGGTGLPADRDPLLLERDCREGYVSAEAAEKLYKR